MGPKIELDAEWVREKYVDDWLSASEIAELADASPRTVRRRLNEYGIDRPDGWENKPIPKERLQREYVDQEQSAREIAKGEDYSRNHVQKSLRHHNISVRSRKEAIRKHHGEHAAYRTHPRGHVMVASGGGMAYVHQLVAIADGANPSDLFDGDAVVHHKNKIPWDNRAENIEVLENQGEHVRKHDLPG